MAYSKRNIPRSFLGAGLLLNNKGQARIGKTAWLFASHDERGAHVSLKLHNTVIVTYHEDDSLTLNHGGWTTVTTASWINQALRGTTLRVSFNKKGNTISNHEGLSIPFDGPLRVSIKDQTVQPVQEA